MKVIIAGGRDFTDYDTLKAKCDYYLSNHQEIEIVSGRCSQGTLTFIASDFVKVYGADGLGERYAKDRGLTVAKFPADWDKYGTSAGPIRNEEMAKYAECLIAFWDGRSSGTGNMIDLAKKYKLKVKVVNY